MSQQAQQFYDQAEKKVKFSGGFLSRVFGGGSFDLEEAVDLYIQAANSFRIAKDGKAAGEAFEKAAQTQERTDSRDGAANILVDAYKAYRQPSPEDAVRVLGQAIGMFMMRGEFRRAANYEMDIGNVYETDLRDLLKAADAYERAGNLYFDDQAEALSNKALLKVGELAALDGRYETALVNIERVIKQSLNSDLSRWSLKENFVKGMFCQMAIGDDVGSQKTLEKYAEWDPSFSATKEYQFLSDMLEAVKAGDEQAFADKLYEYDQFHKLDQWKVSLGLKIKERLEQTEDDDLL